MKKYIILIGDGMADNPVEALSGKTPLEAAEKPVIDALCKKSMLGSVRNVPALLPPGSDTAILSIFGCDPNRYFTGRSPLEAAGCGISVLPGDISYRCNMVTFSEEDVPLEEKRILSHNAGNIDAETSIALITELCADPEFKQKMDAIGLRIEPTPSFRHIAIQRGGDTENMLAAPPHDHLGEVCGSLIMSGNENAMALRELMVLANRKLEYHPLNEQRRKDGKLPANGIWFWAEGTAVQLPNFESAYRHFGSVISAVPLVHGIAALCGLKPVSVEGATGEIDTNYAGKIEAAKKCLLSDDDFLCLHIEAPDEATHNGRLDHKLLAIRQLDELVTKPLTEFLADEGIDYRMLVLSDHKTLMSTRGHDGDPVPFFLYDSTKQEGSGLSYTEKNGLRGPFMEAGTQLLDLLFAE
ncbi:MAG: alkaline phosphatase family protein [Clostridia bacterium]|nr:alkaline phosphatase family protein [Clostridia bacterium]